jgi:hypothetical protein
MGLPNQDGDLARRPAAQAARDRVWPGVSDLLGGFENALAQRGRELIGPVVGVGDSRDGYANLGRDILDRDATGASRFRASCFHAVKLPHLPRRRRQYQEFSEMANAHWPLGTIRHARQSD